MLTPKETLVYLAIKHNGEWKKIYADIKARIDINEKEAKAVLSSLNCEAITWTDPEYPQALRDNCLQPPFVLFYKGDISLIADYSKCVSIVGTPREPSDKCAEKLKELCNGLSEDGKAIVAGGPKGVAEIALKTAKKPVCVLGGGFDRPYPSDHAERYEEIAKRGLLLSEYPPSVQPASTNFVMRNRIVAGLSSKMVVAEANKHSGSAIAVAYALNMGADVGVLLPYCENEFCNELLEQGATPVFGAASVANM